MGYIPELNLPRPNVRSMPTKAAAILASLSSGRDEGAVGARVGAEVGECVGAREGAGLGEIVEGAGLGGTVGDAAGAGEGETVGPVAGTDEDITDEFEQRKLAFGMFQVSNGKGYVVRFGCGLGVRP